MANTKLQVAIVDYGMGNLFSVYNACKSVDLPAVVTSSRQEIESSAGIILPGVGAFGDAMKALRKLDLVKPLQDLAATDKPFMGICLGMQLLMTESVEFGTNEGLGLIQGRVRKFEAPVESNGHKLKVPEIQWSRVMGNQAKWGGTPLDGLDDGVFMYFVHSFYAEPSDERYIVSTSRYGQYEYCSSLSDGNIFGCQYHPERSGPDGLRMYKNYFNLIRRSSK